MFSFFDGYLMDTLQVRRTREDNDDEGEVGPWWAAIMDYLASTLTSSINSYTSISEGSCDARLP